MRVPIALSLVLSAALLAAAGPDPAPRSPRTVRLSLREAVRLALENNLDVEISRYQPWIEDRNIHSAMGAFDHVFYAEGTQSRNRSETTSLLSGASTLDAEDRLLRTGIRRVLPSGASLDLNFVSDRQETNSSFSTLNPTWQKTLGLSVTVPLMKGAGEASTLAPLLLARNSRRIAVVQFEKSLADVVYGVTEAYWGLVAASEVKRFREQALETANRLLEDNRKRFERGVLAKVDVTQAEAGVASQVEGILVAEQARQDAMDRLKRLVDPALLREDTVLLPTDAPAAAGSPLDESRAVEEGVREAFARRPDLRQLQVQLDSQRIAIEKADRDARPRLDAVATGRVNGIDDAFSGAFSDLGEAGSYGWTLGLQLEIPLERRSAEGAAQRAELERRRLVLQGRHLEDQVLVEVRAAAREIKTVEQRIEATRTARVLAQEQFEGEMNRRDQGLRTTFHVLDAQARLSEARTNEVRAATDLALSTARYQRATGTLLVRNEILVDPNLAPRQPVPAR